MIWPHGMRSIKRSIMKNSSRIGCLAEASQVASGTLFKPLFMDTVKLDDAETAMKAVTPVNLAACEGERRTCENNASNRFIDGESLADASVVRPELKICCSVHDRRPALRLWLSKMLLNYTVLKDNPCAGNQGLLRTKSTFAICDRQTTQ